jgi:hypothetical protein
MYSIKKNFDGNFNILGIKKLKFYIFCLETLINSMVLLLNNCRNVFWSVYRQFVQNVVILRPSIFSCQEKFVRVCFELFG